MKFKCILAKRLSSVLLSIAAVALFQCTWILWGEATPPKDVLESNK